MAQQPKFEFSPGLKQDQPEHKESDLSDVFRAHISSFLAPENPDRQTQKIIEQMRLNSLCTPAMRRDDPPYLSALHRAVRTELSSLPPNQRASVCYGAEQASTTIDQLARVSETVGTMIRSNLFSGAEREQKRAVEISDRLSAAPLMVQLRSIENVLRHEPDATVRAQLQRSKEAVESSIAAPFTERVKLAALQLDQKKLEEAEETFDSALKLKLPESINESPGMKQLREQVEAQRRFLETTRSMPDFVTSRLMPQFDKNKSGYLDWSELNASKKSAQSPLERRIINFMLDNYDTLRDSNDEGWFSRYRGISLGDVQKHHSDTRPFELR